MSSKHKSETPVIAFGKYRNLLNHLDRHWVESVEACVPWTSSCLVSVQIAGASQHLASFTLTGSWDYGKQTERTPYIIGRYLRPAHISLSRPADEQVRNGFLCAVFISTRSLTCSLIVCISMVPRGGMSWNRHSYSVSIFKESPLEKLCLDLLRRYI